ncbi:MAG: cardiolipin synthase [Planctomycetota bacterium]|jgi:cardiolipin synthase
MLSVSALLIATEFVVRVLLIIRILLQGRRKPSAQLAWVLVLVALPLFGIFVYLMIGETTLGRRRRARHLSIVQRIDAYEQKAALTIPPSLPHVAPPWGQLAVLAESVGNTTVAGGNQFDLYSDTDEAITALIKDIDGAAEHCHLLFFIYLCDNNGRRVAKALERAVTRGVTCRLLVDAVGSRSFLKSSLCEELRRTGVKIVGALPASAIRLLAARIDLRNPRKIVVIDVQIGYLGSQNIADASFAPKAKYAPWVDAMVRVVGPATRDLQVLFIEDWYLDSGEGLENLLNIIAPVTPGGMIAQVIGTGPNSRNEGLRELNHAAIHLARDEIIVTTPYFVPDDATAAALGTAARRGVTTILVLPAINDSPFVAAASRRLYGPMLEAGVQIHHFNDGLLHAKTMTVDRDLAMIGSANLDRRSFELNFEVSLVVYDTDFASRLRLLQRSYMDNSTQIDPDKWLLRRWPRRLVDNAAGTLAPLL